MEHTVVGVTHMVCNALTAIGLTMSAVKNVVLASSSKLGTALQEKLALWGVRYRTVARMLGVGAAAGIRRVASVATQRFVAFARRRGQFGKLRRLGVNVAKLLATGGNAATEYGQECFGVADYFLLQMRRNVAAVIGGGTAGKDHNLALIAAEASWGHRADPAFAAHEGPIVAWARAMWECWLPQKMMHCMVRRARVALVKARRPWSSVKGPGAAAVATAARIGWTVIDAATAYTDAGREVCFLRDSPAMVALLVQDSVRRWRWNRVCGSMAGEVQKEVVWQPVAQLLKSGRYWTSNREDVLQGPRLSNGEKASLRSAVAGGQWPQAKLFQANLADHPHCLLCLHNGIEVAGTLRHRLQCPVIADRASAPRGDVVGAILCCLSQGEAGSMATAASNDDAAGIASLKLEKAIFVQRKVTLPLPEESTEWIMGEPTLEEGLTVYLDGSMIDGPDDSTAVLGWSAVVMRDREVKAIVRGVTPGYVRSVPASEMWALAMATLHFGATFTKYFTDCKAVRDIARSGKERATAASQVNARIWLIIFNHTDDLVPLIEWLPSHKGREGIGMIRIGDGSMLTFEQTGKEISWRTSMLKRRLRRQDT